MARNPIPRLIPAFRTSGAVMCAGALAAFALSGCGGHSPGGSAGSSTTPPSRQSGGHGPAPLKDSKYFFMTKLSKDKLCGLLSGGEAAAVLGTRAGPTAYSDPEGDGVVCTWSKRGGGRGLYIGISTILPWRAAATLTTYANGHPTVIDGHQANAGGWVPNFQPYASAYVAIAGPDDPVVQFRAPTRERVLMLARLVMPRLVALGTSAR